MQASNKNAVIMAAGTSSRFTPLSHEMPKGLLTVKGEVLIERQIRQLQTAGISDITIVVGYMAEKFAYLKSLFNVELVYNEDFYRYNNTSSLMRVLDKLENTFICSSDNYFPQNVFAEKSDFSYYSALYSKGFTDEYCLKVDGSDNIVEVNVGGVDSWFMVGHVYLSKEFTEKFKIILSEDYLKDETKTKYWEDVYITHIKDLPPLKINRYNSHDIEEFDSLDELRKFDVSYQQDSRSAVLKDIAKRLNCEESELYGFKNMAKKVDQLLFSFRKDDKAYLYDGGNNGLSAL